MPATERTGDVLFGQWVWTEHLAEELERAAITVETEDGATERMYPVDALLKAFDAFVVVTVGLGKRAPVPMVEAAGRAVEVARTLRAERKTVPM